MPHSQDAHSTVPVDSHRLNGTSCLDDRTLVLNRSWLAVNVTTARRALTLAYAGCARIIQVDTFQAHDFRSWVAVRPAPQDRAIRGVGLHFRAPEIIVLMSYDQQPVLRVPFSRRNLFYRDNFRCQYCGVRTSTDNLSIDHVIPRSRGGLSTWTNCVLACHDCNVRKGNRTPHEASMRLSRSPAQPRWPVYLSLGADHRRDSWQRFISEPLPSPEPRNH